MTNSFFLVKELDVLADPDTAVVRTQVRSLTIPVRCKLHGDSCASRRTARSVRAISSSRPSLRFSARARSKIEMQVLIRIVATTAGPAH